MHDVNAKGFYTKNMTRTEQDHDTNMYPKLMLNILKIMWDLTSFIPIGHLVQGSFSRNFQPTCGPCTPMCG